MREALRKALIQAVERSDSPGGVAWVGDPDRTFFRAAVGHRVLLPQPQPALVNTPYDLASLTKVVATTTAVLLLNEDGALDLDAPIGAILPIAAFATLTPRQLLTHTAGLVAGRPYYQDAATIEGMLDLHAERGVIAPPGTRRIYSDVGFMILGKIVELVARDSLDAFCRKRIFRPLGMQRTAFNPPARWARTCAATEACPWRGRTIVGQVHDENAYAVGGVAGHAGLFSTADDLARFCRALLAGRLLSEASLAAMTAPRQVPFYPWQGLGWKLDPWGGGSSGYLPCRRAFGHTGWTGTSLWMDRDTGLFAILLGNTCHPSRTERDTPTFRRVFHDAVAREFFPRQTNTHTGLDRLVRDGFRAVRGKRIGLLTNHAAVDQHGRPILDVLALERDVNVVLVFSPEHGVRGTAEAGEGVQSERDRVPVISLYGDQKRPTKAQLAKVDLFVVDLQDVGARYYTYMATMLECLKACARGRTPVLVLDRPNPIGGEALEGANLFDECALPWTPPSPNIPTPETALLYAGLCLFEGVNLNEGRGTDTPFHLVGAPWLDAQAVVRRIPRRERSGCTLEATTYTPRSIPGKASRPRFLGEPCQGIRIAVHDPRRVRAFTLAVALLCAIRRRHPDRLEFTRSFDVLAGTPRLREMIEAGQSPRRIVDAFAPASKTFAEQRPRLYA